MSRQHLATLCVAALCSATACDDASAVAMAGPSAFHNELRFVGVSPRPQFSLADAAANAPLELLLRGRYFLAPADLHLTVAVEPHPDNRVLRIELDGGAMFRASDLTLDGEHEKRLHVWRVRGLPAGDYHVTAALFSERTLRARVEDNVVVTGDPNR